MREHLPLLRRSKIFADLTDDEILSALSCLNASTKTFKKGNFVFRESDEANCIGIVLSGEIQTQKVDYDGNINIISSLFPSDLIAAVASFSTLKRLPFDVAAVCGSEVLCLDNKRLIRTCCSACAFHAKIVENMLSAVADKNIELSLKIDVLTKRTIREKVLAFLYSQSKNKDASFSVNLSRRQTAEYLSVNRSALSRELCKMQDEGILEFDGNRFTLR